MVALREQPPPVETRADVLADMVVCAVPASPRKPAKLQDDSQTGAASASQGLPTWVRYHDFWNLAALAVLNALNFFCLVTGSGFSAFWYTTMLYFLGDLVFIGAVPSCVKSPNVLLVHHIISSLYILIPHHYPEYQWCMSYCMLVEINTWFLIAKRTWTSVRVFETCFYVSWVALRNVLYPWLIYAFYHEWRSETAKCGSPWNPILITPIFQVALTALNCQWTYTLMSKRPSKGNKQL